MDDILHNLQVINSRIEAACSKSHRERSEVKLLLATKTVTPDRIITAFKAGYTLIGENKVQEIKEKYDALQLIPHVKHFIGHLQTNKIKDVINYGVSCIETVDRIELAEKLHQRLLAENKTMDVMIQVNTSNEQSKFGISPDEAANLTKQVSQFETLKIKGLMTIGLFSSNTEKVRSCYKLLKNIQQQIIALNIPNVEMNELSMGMSGDLETAIEEGSTIVRVGTAVFGKRIYPDSYYWNENK
ncbi:MAG: YggS family pyridoxal phosphate-dependent enzyme [Ignavibacteriaceae bacterium]|nr:YggS family pyridoxal phosphate-dependent enzyme [Ignavibacteriaceae bacterium]